ncbi:hypothetical protein SDY_4527 [Shigella dysenteriae Sd197]|uniref:Uncharacterized protein n=1 Tax=Shigella dysenteriae serotype 1 (strain Sd197) TaxID=300267 RepID=Q327V4_SHIDS|nr:hypothetical protein SDY_4527 [Shigella dysenteriae Sd197]
MPVVPGRFHRYGDQKCRPVPPLFWCYTRTRASVAGLTGLISVSELKNAVAVTAAKSVMAFRVLTMAVDLCRLTTRTMNVNAGHERTSKARIIHQIQLIRGITISYLLN